MGVPVHCRECGETHEAKYTRLNDAHDAAEAVLSHLLAAVPHVVGTYGGWYYRIRTTGDESLHLGFYREQGGEAMHWHILHVARVCLKTCKGALMPVGCPWHATTEQAPAAAAAGQAGR